MVNQQEIDSNDPKKRARAILETCLAMRKRVYDFLQMGEETQKEQNQEEIHSAFSHLADCQNQEAFIALAGNAQGAGLCNALWKKISKEYDEYSDLVCDHLRRVKDPDFWQELEEARKKDEAGIKPGFIDRCILFLCSWMFTPPKKSREKKEEGNGKN